MLFLLMHKELYSRCPIKEGSNIRALHSLSKLVHDDLRFFLCINESYTTTAATPAKAAIGRSRNRNPNPTCELQVIE